MSDRLLGYIPYIEARCRTIRIAGFDAEDIRQEAILAVLLYLNECEKTGAKPTEGAVRNVVHRHIYKLIRENVTFDGCVESTREAKRSIKRAASNNTITPEGVSDLFEQVPGETPTAYEKLANHDALEKFAAHLTPTEKTIFKYMMDGHYKPREICMAMHGVVRLSESKTISNHTVKIKQKFATFWFEQTGKRFQWKKKSN